jgi:hypothetical protein
MMNEQKSNAKNHKILAIEDDPEVLQLYVSFFQRKGYDVLKAGGVPSREWPYCRPIPTRV